MIELHNVSHHACNGDKPIVENLTFRFPARKTIGIIGRSGSGKSQLLRLLAGVNVCFKGAITRAGRTSWPLSVMGGLHPNLSLKQNLDFLNQLYFPSEPVTVDQLLSFMTIDIDPNQKLNNLPARSRAQLSLAIAMSVDFDTYLFDDVTIVGGPKLKDKAERYLKHQLNKKTKIIANRDLQHIKAVCDAVCILHQGTLKYFDAVDDGIRVYKNSIQI